jgi:hydroxypyruvate isomerase
MDRRQALTLLGAAALAPRAEARARHDAALQGSGRLNQSVSRWPFSAIPLPEFCRACRDIGLAGIDLLGPEDWPVVADHGLVVTMGYPTARRDFIATGFNDPANHAMLLRELEATIPLAAAARVPNVIAMFGNRGGTSDAAGIEHCVAGLKRIAPLAEERGVTVCVELLNSRVDHADYQGDRTAFGVAVIAGVASPRVKLLYDIYHMQIMEGHPHHPPQHRPHRPFPYRRRARAPRDRRRAGAELPGRRPRHRGQRFPGVRRPRIRPGARSAHLAPRGRGDL